MIKIVPRADSRRAVRELMPILLEEEEGRRHK
jgi:hypothetical protein